jgi:hypothetical protein
VYVFDSSARDTKGAHKDQSLESRDEDTMGDIGTVAAIGDVD